MPRGSINACEPTYINITDSSSQEDVDYEMNRVDGYRAVQWDTTNILDVHVYWGDVSRSWEPLHNVPRHFVVNYYKLQRPPLTLPANIDESMAQ